MSTSVPEIPTTSRGFPINSSTHPDDGTGRLGAPRIHDELLKLGFVVSEITVWRYMPRRPTEPDQVKRWIAFFAQRKDVIAAMDLFTVPTATPTR